MERADKPGLWELPGGRIDQEETDQESFKREIREEIGLEKFEIIGPVDYYIWLNTPARAHACGITNLIKNDCDKIRFPHEIRDCLYCDEKSHKITEVFVRLAVKYSGKYIGSLDQ